MGSNINPLKIICKLDDGILVHNVEDDSYSLLTETPESECSSQTSSITIKSDSDERNKVSERQNIWSKTQTLFLLEKYKLKQEEFENPRFKKIDLFKDIAGMLQNELNCQFTPVQCQNRIKTLFNKYKEIRDHNNTSGKGRKDWEFFDQVADVMGDRPSVVPKASCSSIRMSEYSSGSSESSENCIRESEQGPKAKKRKLEKRATPRGELQKFLKEYKVEQDEKEQKKVEMIERHHEENKTLLQQLIDVLKK